MLQHAVSATVSLFRVSRGEYELNRRSIRVSVSV
jgi:hypothetical protein